MFCFAMKIEIVHRQHWRTAGDLRCYAGFFYCAYTFRQQWL